MVDTKSLVHAENLLRQVNAAGTAGALTPIAVFIDGTDIPGSFASAGAIARIMTQKFVMAISLYRQTMSNWVLRATEDHLLPVYEDLHR